MKDKLTGKSLDRLVILAILAAILGLSGYSLYTILRHYGAAPLAAVSASAGLDFVALFAARFSLKYARKGLSGSFPRAVVLIFAALGMAVQTLHARIGGEPLIMMAFWASLPLSAVITYEIYLRWTSRKALIRAGHVFPAAKPSYGFYTWARHFPSTLDEFDFIMLSRRASITEHHAARYVVADEQIRASLPERPAPPAPPTAPRPASKTARKTKQQRAHAPVIGIREWAQQKGYTNSTHGRLRQAWIDEYHAERAAAS